MKVKDLIKYLQELPPAYGVYYYDAYMGDTEIIEFLHLDIPEKIQIDKANKRIILDLRGN